VSREALVNRMLGRSRRKLRQIASGRREQREIANLRFEISKRSGTKAEKAKRWGQKNGSRRLRERRRKETNGLLDAARFG